jgi:hypothetical protein
MHAKKQALKAIDSIVKEMPELVKKANMRLGKEDIFEIQKNN